METGAVSVTRVLVSPAAAATLVGTLGTVAGVTVAAADAALVPTLLVAVTVQEYSVPLVSPETVMGLVVAAPVRVLPAAGQVAV